VHHEVLQVINNLEKPGPPYGGRAFSCPHVSLPEKGNLELEIGTLGSHHQRLGANG
jgi:hypothetical protein